MAIKMAIFMCVNFNCPSVRPSCLLAVYTHMRSEVYQLNRMHVPAQKVIMKNDI